MSLQKRFLLFLVLLPAFGLLVFLLFSVQVFRTEKLLTVQDFQSSQARSMALLIESELQSTADLEANLLRSNLKSDDFFNQYVIDENGQILADSIHHSAEAVSVSPSNGVDGHHSILEVLSPSIIEKLNLIRTGSGAFRISDRGSIEHLVSFARIAQRNWTVLVVTPMSIVDHAVYSLATKAVGLFLGLIGISILLSHWLARKITNRILDLSQSAKKFGTGNFSHRTNLTGEDELTELGQQFNDMAQQIQTSLKTEEEKTRLKLEMETAKNVQETLFLPGTFSHEKIEISGYYQPAKECGGDWWYYFRKGDSIWVGIGDVTGHGVGSAMLTSSIRSAFSLIEKMDQIRPQSVLKMLNQVVCETVGGKLNMTFCVLEIKPRDSKIIYANASHEFPILMQKGKLLKRNEITYLLDATGARLGDRPDSQYEEHEISFQENMRLICVSDGVCDVLNPQGKAWGERRFLKALGALNGTASNPAYLVKELNRAIESHRKNANLPDDISMICIDFG